MEVNSIPGSTKRTSSSRNLYQFIAQVLVILLIVSFSLYNLTVTNENKELWVSLMSSCVGYMLPNPKLKI